jgi:hypothetical protein
VIGHAPADTTKATEATEAVAARIAEHWGEHSHTAVAAMIADLYDELVVFPPSWPPHRCHRVLTEAADTIATELVVLLDDYLDDDAARPQSSDHGWSIHSQDRHHGLVLALTALTEEHLHGWLSELIGDLIVDDALADPGRGEGSMTACSAKHRPPTLIVWLPHRRRGRRRPWTTAAAGVTLRCVRFRGNLIGGCAASI